MQRAGGVLRRAAAGKWGTNAASLTSGSRPPGNQNSQNAEWGARQEHMDAQPESELKPDSFRQSMLSEHDPDNLSSNKLVENAAKKTGRSMEELKRKGDEAVKNETNEPLSRSSTGSMANIDEPDHHIKDRGNVLKGKSAGERAEDARKNPHQYAVDALGNSTSGEI